LSRRLVMLGVARISATCVDLMTDSIYERRLYRATDRRRRHRSAIHTAVLLSSVHPCTIHGSRGNFTNELMSNRSTPDYIRRLFNSLAGECCHKDMR